MSNPKEKKTVYVHDPEQLLKHGITNRVVDSIRAYLSRESGKAVVFSPDARNQIKAIARQRAVVQDAKYAAIQTAFWHKKNWNPDFVASKADGKHFRILVPFASIAKPKKDKPAKDVKPAKTGKVAKK